MDNSLAIILQLAGAGLLFAHLAINIGIFWRLFTFKDFADQFTNAFHSGTSVVIAACNEAENLAANLPHILKQDHSRFEVIVVNDHSDDDTISEVQKLQQEYANLHLINLGDHVWQKPGKKLALLLGIKKAQYEVILLTDADCYPATDQWIQLMEAPFAHETIQFTIGVSPYRRGWGLLSGIVRYETYQTALSYVSLGLNGMPYMGVGRNLAYRRQFFLDARGFGPHHYLAAGDDDLLVNRLATADNTTYVLNSNAYTWSSLPKSWGEWIKQKQRHLSVGKFYHMRHKLILGALWFLQFCFYLILIACLILAPSSYQSLGLLGLKIVSFYAMSFPLLRRFQMKSLIPLAFILDVIYHLFYLPFVGITARIQKTGNAWA